MIAALELRSKVLRNGKRQRKGAPRWGLLIIFYSLLIIPVALLRTQQIDFRSIGRGAQGSAIFSKKKIKLCALKFPSILPKCLSGITLHLLF